MRVPINGVSMLPLIRRNRDLVTIVPVDRPVRRGDIVLFYDPRRTEKQYVLHRAWTVNTGAVETWGDNCLNPDGFLKSENIWGFAVTVERGKKTIRLDTDPARRLGIALAHCRHTDRRARLFVIRTAKKVLPAPVTKFLKKLRHQGN